MNRVQTAIDGIDAAIKAKKVSPENLAELDKSLNISLGEYVAFQNAQSQAHAGGILTLDEAQAVYGILGTGPDTFNSRPLATKMAITKLMAELLKLRIG
jgi:hypothetical protein